MAYALPADVELDPAAPAGLVEEQVERLIEDAEAILDALVPGIADRITAGTLNPVIARRVVVAAVLRRLNNPRGYKGEHAGEYGYYYAEGSVKGGGWFTDDELALLRPAISRVGTIRINVPGQRTESYWP